MEDSAVEAREVQRSLGRIEGKLDRILQWTQDHELLDNHRFEKLDERISENEQVRWKYTGGAGVLAAIGTFVVTYFFNKVT